MVRFTDSAFYKEDHFFVDEDPNRIYRGLKDLLVNEFDMDRIEEMRNEFNVQKPKDKTRLYAYKEKSPHTLIEYNLEFRAKRPKKIYKMERHPDVMKARVTTSATVISYYPGRNELSFEPKPSQRSPFTEPEGGGLRDEESRWQRSKLYEKFAGIWHEKLYSRQIDKYKEEAEETCLRIHDLMRQKFGAEKTIGKSGRSEYRPPWSG